MGRHSEGYISDDVFLDKARSIVRGYCKVNLVKTLKTGEDINFSVLLQGKDRDNFGHLTAFFTTSVLTGNVYRVDCLQSAPNDYRLTVYDFTEERTYEI